MAKWGEGDERWKVEDLGDSGRNVNGWHWVENNALPWSKDRLKELLCEIVLVDKDGTVMKTTSDITLTGDAVINQRKGKIIPAYELNLTLKWEGVNVEVEEGKGEVKVPYISEENHDEDPEVQITVTSGGAAAEKMRNLIVNHGRKIVQHKIAQFVKEVHAGGPIKLGSEPAAAQRSSSGAGTNPANQAPTTAAPAPVTAPAPPKPVVKSSGRSIEITETYFASARDLYECFTNTARVRAFTGSVAEIDPTPGGKFSMFGGSIEGAFRELQPPSTIDMDWRFSSWPDGATSRVVITLEEKEKGAVTLHLKQNGIPDADRYGNHDVLGMTQSGWKQQVLLRIRQVRDRK